MFRGLYSPDGIVRDAGVASDTLYVGGVFGFVAAPTGTVAVLDKATGAPDLSQARFGGVVWVVIPDGAGGFYAGGAFERVDGVLQRNLAHVLPDGRLDPAFRPNPTGQINPDNFGQVNVLALDGGVLYVGGRFDVVAGQPRRNLAALDAATGALRPLSVTMTSANQGGGDPRGFLQTVVVRDGVLYVGGLFDEVNGLVREGAFAVRLATGTVLPWNPLLNRTDFGGNVSGEATAFGLGESTLYVSGLFDTLRGAPRRGSAEVSLADPVTGEGGAPTPWNPGFSGGRPFLTVTEDYIWLESYFPPALFRVSRATGQSQSFLVGLPYTFGSAITYDPTGGVSGQGTLYLACRKRDPDAPRGTYNAVIGVDPATGRPTGFEVLAGTGPLGNYSIRSVAVVPGPGGRVIAAGEPTQYGGEPRRFLAGLDLTTGRLTDFGAEYIVNSSIDEVAISPDERFAYFTSFNGIGVGDLTTGELYDFPGGRALAAQRAAWAGERSGGSGDREADSLSVRRPGPVVTRADGSPAPAFRPPPSADPAALRSGDGSGGERAVRGGTGALVASSDRLYAHPEGGVVAFDRFTGAVVWTTTFSEFVESPDVPKILLVEGGAPGAPGDTLFASGAIYEADGQPRTLFVALDAETGDVLGWNVITNTAQSGATGSGLAAVPGDSRVFLGSLGVTVAGGQPRRGVFAASRASGALAPWNPNPAGVAAFGVALVAQAGADGRASVVYASDVGGVQVPAGAPFGFAGAFDGSTGARLSWDPRLSGGGASWLLLAERQGWVVAGGSFASAGPGGHANLVAVRPAVPFAVAGEAGALDAPGASSLALAGPNPFRSRTALALTLPEAQAVEASLFDVLGRRVAVLHEGPLGAGTHTLTVDGSALPAGVYVARVSGNTFAASQTLTVVR